MKGDLCKIEGCIKTITYSGKVCTLHRYFKRKYGKYDCERKNKKHSHSKSRLHGFIHTRKNLFYSLTLIPNNNNCMEWIGSLNSKGYGQISINNKPMGAHRFSYLLHFGEIPSHLEICHHCDNRKCVAPNHLFLGTRKDNMQDALKKGRMNLKGLKNYE